MQFILHNKQIAVVTKYIYIYVTYILSTLYKVIYENTNILNKSNV